MAYFGKTEISPEADIIGRTTVDQADDGGFDLAGALSDPNVIRALGELGARVGGRDSVGEMLGTTGSELERRKAVQKAGAQQSQRQATFQDRLINALSAGTLLSPTEDNAAPDSVTLTGDGGATINFKNTPQKVGFAGEQAPLEASRRVNNLPDFFKASLG